MRLFVHCALAGFLVVTGCDETNPVDLCTGKTCFDGVSCTRDECNPAVGVCTNTADDGLCKPEERCDAKAGCVVRECTENADCDDGKYCNGTETCQGNLCAAGVAPECGDGVACTVDTCDETSDKCAFAADDLLCGIGEKCDPVLGCVGTCQVDADCADGLVCNGTEVCVNGACAQGTPLGCNDQVECTLDGCSELALGCEYIPDHEACPQGELCNPSAGCEAVTCQVDGDCDDGFWCNGAELCDAGTCALGIAPQCDDQVPCTVDRCEESTDACGKTPDDSLCKAGEVCDAEQGCVIPPCVSDADCDDGVYCNGAERCEAGKCVAGTPPVCDDSIPCTVDACDEETDACEFVPDHTQCPLGELCDPSLGCHAVGCSGNQECDDGVFCNGAETCGNGGNCEAGAKPDCDDDVACTHDSCDEGAGACLNQADDVLCDNGTWCDGVEKCDAQLGCKAGAAVDCADSVECTVDACDEAQDKCVSQPNDDLCSDGQWCTGVETCDWFSGCKKGTPVDCADKVACTEDSCDEVENKCLHKENDKLCDNGVRCDGAESCDAVQGCLPGTPVDCDDQVDCTVDVCVEGPDSTGCDHKPDDLLCDDTNPCTSDQCDLGSDPPGCRNSALRDGTPCSDLNMCNGAEACRSGMCRAGQPLVCMDPGDLDNPCTRNTCSPGSGCLVEAVPKGGSCSDGDPCNGAEVCDGEGRCVAGLALECDDHNPCTQDSCLAGEGCVHLALSEPCDDGDACTSGDRCQEGGVCRGALIEICGDGLDNDCDEQIDEDCEGSGTFVATWGNDLNPGTQAEPFQTIGHGILQATSLGAPRTVYVQKGEYSESIAMMPGISVVGGFSEKWIWDPANQKTVLRASASPGVAFSGSGIARDTVLESLVIYGRNDVSPGRISTTILISGSRPTLSNNTVTAGFASTCQGVLAQDEAEPLLVGNTIVVDSCETTSWPVVARGAGLEAIGNQISGKADSTTVSTAVGVMLDGALDVVLLGNAIAGGFSMVSSMTTGRATSIGIQSVGGFRSLLIEQNVSIVGGAAQSNSALAAGISLTNCAGVQAVIRNNAVITGGSARASMVDRDPEIATGIVADGSCPVEIAGNGRILGADSLSDVAFGIGCTTNSLCRVIDNALVAGTLDDIAAQELAAGISCGSNSCGEIARNALIQGGRAPTLAGLIVANGAAPAVDANFLWAGVCSATGIPVSTAAAGIWLVGCGGQYSNNGIYGGEDCSASDGMRVIAPVAGDLVVHSNYLNGLGTSFVHSNASSAGLRFLLSSNGGNPLAKGVFQNNVINAGLCDSRVPVWESSRGIGPVTFKYNDLVGGTVAHYIDEGTQMLLSIEQVNALPEAAPDGGNIAVYPDIVNEMQGDLHLNPASPLIDAGTEEGAPDHDIYNVLRPQGAGFDIGPAEWTK